jgi:hypothetical protein
MNFSKICQIAITQGNVGASLKSTKNEKIMFRLFPPDHNGQRIAVVENKSSVPVRL